MKRGAGGLWLALQERHRHAEVDTMHVCFTFASYGYVHCQRGFADMFTRKRQAALVQRLPAEAATGVGYEALHFLSQHALEHTPVNYALAWSAKNDRRSIAAMSVDAIVMEGRGLTQADLDRITIAETRYTGNVVTSPDPQQDALRHQTLRLAELAAGAATQSSEFGEDLKTGLFQLSGGEKSVEQIVAAMVQRTRGVEARLTAASKEIEGLRQQVEASRHDAERDALTGLLNRRGALQELTSRRRSDRGVAALCDIDHFKTVNDRFGHGVGDRVLKGVSTCLAENVGVHTVARWGGEEFLIVLDEVDLPDAFKLLDRTREDLAGRSFKLRCSGEPLGGVTISIGAVALAGSTVDDAIDAADRMLYAAKSQGRNRVVVDAAIGNAT